jgi:enoyl-CoA hydratase/carnithine racemase
MAEQWDLSGTQALRRLVPLDVAKELIFSGEPISGEQAVAWHLGTQLSESPLENAFGLARVITGHSPDAVRAAKQLLNASGLVSPEEALANEFRGSARLLGSENRIEAVMSRLQKREPEFADPEG